MKRIRRALLLERTAGMLDMNGGRHVSGDFEASLLPTDDLPPEFEAEVRQRKTFNAESELRRQLLEQQDRDYQQSSLRDRLRQQQEAIRKKQEEDERRAKEEAEAKAAAEEQAKQERIAKLLSLLPDEPDASVPNCVTLAIRTPSNERKKLQRRFNASDQVQTLLDYLTCEGFDQEEHEVCTAYPKQVLNVLRTKTFAEVGLQGRATVHCTRL